MTDQTFDIILLTGDNKEYYGDSIRMSELVLASGNYVPLSRMDIPLGQSRYGGPVVDLPPGETYPEDLLFAAQIDLAQASPPDHSGRLPRTGQLIFFAGNRADTVRVIYADIPNGQLVRTVREHEDQFFSGRLITGFAAATERLSDRYREPEEEDEQEDANEHGKIWDDYAEGKKSKMFGIYTNVQWGEDDILEVLESDQIVLLQIGEDMNDEGVFTVMIDKEALARRDFSGCTVGWAQT